MKRCLLCGHECESHFSTCPMCGEGSWIDLTPARFPEPMPRLEPVTKPDAAPAPKRSRK